MKPPCGKHVCDPRNCKQLKECQLFAFRKVREEFVSKCGIVKDGRRRGE